MHLVLTDTNNVIDSLSSSVLNLYFQEGNLSAESSDKKNDEETSDEKKECILNKSELQEESLSPTVRQRKIKTKVLTLEVKKRTIIRPHEKCYAPRLQTQAMASLAAGVNKMAKLQTKRLKLKEESEKERKKERENLLKFRREEAERNRQHELQLAKMCMQMLGMPQTSCSTTSHKFWSISRYVKLATNCISRYANCSDFASSNIEQFKYSRNKRF